MYGLYLSFPFPYVALPAELPHLHLFQRPLLVMEPHNLKATDSDNGQTPSENEKLHIENGVPVPIIDVLDPDEHLSEEERKRIV